MQYNGLVPTGKAYSSRTAYGRTVAVRKSESQTFGLLASDSDPVRIRIFRIGQSLACYKDVPYSIDR